MGKIKQPIGVGQRDVALMIVALRGAAMRFKDAPAEALLTIKTTKDLDARAIASYAHIAEELARRLERTRETVFNEIEHQVILAALRVCAEHWPKMAQWSVARGPMLEKFAVDCLELQERLEPDLPGRAEGVYPRHA